MNKPYNKVSTALGLCTSNICFMTDSYKVSHWMQFPVGMTRSEYYVESRNGGKFDELVAAGIHYLTTILEKGVTKEEVLEAHEFYLEHFGMDVFNLKGWMDIVERFDGKLPITVRAVREGEVVPTGNAIMVISTESGFGWLAGYLETLILRCIWYPSTVATISFETRKLVSKAMQDSSDLEGMDAYMTERFRLHDFGARGVSSAESAAVGGLAHLYSFSGSDTVEGIMLARTLFGFKMAGNSIPAREHSTTTCYLREGEYDAFMNSVEQFGGGLFAVVIDSYSTKKALEWLLTNKRFLEVLREKGGTCVLRPDSGLPEEMVHLCLDMAWKLVGGTRNSKGYKVLDKSFRVIQGDGVNADSIRSIVNSTVYIKKYSMENLVFGMGGGLLQHCDRDTQRFAMKCSAMEINGEWRDVFKSPETDPTKKSKAGRLDLIKTWAGYETIALGDNYDLFTDDSVLKVVFRNGERLNCQDLEDIRSILDKACQNFVVTGSALDL